MIYEEKKTRVSYRLKNELQCSIIYTALEFFKEEIEKYEIRNRRSPKCGEEYII